MSLSAWEQQALDSIKDRLADSEPQLTVLLTTFTELAPGEMPVRERIRASSRWAMKRRRSNWPHRNPDKVCWSERRMHLRLSLQARARVRA
jgi:hypothetical protein